jgi:hypothetical protein
MFSTPTTEFSCNFFSKLFLVQNNYKYCTVKGKGTVVPVHAMKTYGQGVAVETQALVTSALDGDE